VGTTQAGLAVKGLGWLPWFSVPRVTASTQRLKARGRTGQPEASIRPADPPQRQTPLLPAITRPCYWVAISARTQSTALPWNVLSRPRQGPDIFRSSIAFLPFPRPAPSPTPTAPLEPRRPPVPIHLCACLAPATNETKASPTSREALR
jgi:hypothetical protein